MAVQLALPNSFWGWFGRLNLPKRVPPFGTPAFYIFTVIWISAFLMALVGPAMGIYYRYSTPADNSQLMLGSRIGVAVSRADATHVRFLVGNEARKAGIRPGDDIVAVFGLPLPAVLPMTEQAVAEHAEDPAYIAMGNLLFGTESMEVPITVRSPSGAEREVVIETGEQHIRSAVRGIGLPPGLLNYVDLLHVITYPFLLWASWILHRRNSRDAVSSVLSLAILLTMVAEQPSATFLGAAGVPRSLHVFLFDLGNMCLLAGILLFPHGTLTPRRLLLLALIPVLTLLHGDVYRVAFLSFMGLSVLILLRLLRKTQAGDLRQQIRWALFGFTGYAMFIATSYLGDMLKNSVGSFETQLLVEMVSGLALGLAFMTLQFGLLIALLRYRLYDAEAIISRTASIAIVTLVIGAVGAAVMEGIITQMQNMYEDSQTPAAMVGAVMATMLIHPLHSKVQGWVERHFHKNLLKLRQGLPEAMRDLREIASPDAFIEEVLDRVNEGVYAHQSAFVLGREVKRAVGVPQAEVLRWLMAFQPEDGDGTVVCDSAEPLFPLRLKIQDTSGAVMGWILIGRRPDGSIAGTDEREALEELAVPIARSLKIVLSRELERQELVQLLDAHRMRIERLESCLQM